jgi:uncharacterized membrane protein
LSEADSAQSTASDLVEAHPAATPMLKTPESGKRQILSGEHLVVGYVVIAVGLLILLRASIDELEFLSVGWILVLVTLPLIPWLLPRLGDFLKRSRRTCRASN